MDSAPRDKSITPDDELLFSLFCIENVAASLGKTGSNVYRSFVEGDILNGYIVPCYEALHSQSRQYVVDELTELMQRRGVLA